jgi:hypothetical protein
MTNDIYARPDADGDAFVDNYESSASGVSWAAIIAGAVAAAAMALILMTLGAGLGFLSVSPYDDPEAALAAAGIGAIIWSVVVHVASFGLGGFLAGRLRTKWANIHGDEVYFRDTAHGFVSWAVAMLISTAMMICLAGMLARGTAEVVGTAATGVAGAAVAGSQLMAAEGDAEGGMMDYFTDMMFRPGGSVSSGADASGAEATGNAATTDTTAATGTSEPLAPMMTPLVQPAGAQATDAERTRARMEAGRIFVTSIAEGEASPADKAYLAQLISIHTGMSQEEAAQRVDEVMTQAQTAINTVEEEAKQAADAARKAAAGAALWAFAAMLIGAFSASYAATIGGRARDR